MILAPAADTPLLGLIDEPFRGTNSRDQSAASIAVVHHLLQSPGLFLIATHDQHLTELADGGAAHNCHFREDLSNGEFVFDYHLHPGPAQTRNALRILECEGYPPALVRQAHEWLGE
jgi:DNA mismatch repair ATPase MutS